MEIKLLKVLVNGISSFFHLSAHENINSQPLQKYYQKIEEVLKLIKPVLDAIIDTEIASDEKLQKAFAGLSQAVEELRELFENWQPLMSKVYFVLQVESMITKVQNWGLEIFELPKSSDEFIPSELSVASLELCVQKLKHIGYEQTSAIISEAIKDQVEVSGARSDSLVKIADCLSLKSNQELLIEAVALEKLKENAEQAEKNGEADYIDQIIALVAHMHDRLVLMKQSEICSPVPIPADFCCPLSLELMTDPVIVASGQTYERAFIRKWIDLGLTVCPKTRQTLAHTNLIPNYTVKALIANWCESNNVKLPDPLKSMSLNQPALLLAHAESGTPRDSHADGVNYSVVPYLPTDSELAAAFVDRKKREGSVRGFGIRTTQSVKGSDSWVDDPITRHIISLYINKEEAGDSHLLWPLMLHIKGPFYLLALPLVEPRHLKTYARMCNRSDCGNTAGSDESLSSLLLDLPSITGAFMVIHTIGDIVTGDITEPEVVVSASPSVGGLLDSLTGSIGISARAKPVAAPMAASATSSTSVSGAVASDAPKIGSRPLDKDTLRSFISSSMPFGTPLDLSFSNFSAMKINGFASADMPPADSKQPAWKPYLYRGKQRIHFTIHETIQAAMYDRDEIPDTITVSGQVNCRAELEGLPDVSFPLTGLDSARVELLSFHPCAQVPEHGGDKHAVTFSPPLGNFLLMRYQVSDGIRPPVKGFYQLSMVSENEGAFLFKLRLMEGYKAPLSLEFCTVTMPFPRRRVVSFDGTPSIGAVSTTEHSVEWKIIMGGRGVSGKSIEATFPGTLKFAPWQTNKLPSSGPVIGSIDDEDSDFGTDSANNMVNVEDFLMEKMSKDLQAVDLEEPFCWQAYSYAKVSFKMVGTTLSGMSIDPKSVSIFPAVKAPVEFSAQVTSGDYILWNTLGKCPVAATPKA